MPTALWAIRRANITINVPEYGPGHSEVAATLTNLGNAYGAFGDTLR